MKFIKLGEVIYGAKTDRCGDKNFPVLSITKSDGIVLQSEKFKKRIASNDTQQYKVVKKGQLVQGIHIDEANFGIQTIVDAGIVSPAYKIWNVDESKIIPKYLEIILRSPKSIRYYSSNFNGSVKRRERLSDKDFLAMDIPCPSLLEQQKAINLIVQLKEIINLREQELQKLDDLVKARFVELFGDPIHNTQNRPTTEFVNVVKMQRGFDLPVQDRQQDGNIPVYGSNGALDHHNVAKVTGGGVITGRSGTIGKVFYTEGDYWPLNTSLFSVDTHGNNVIYLAKLLELYDLSRFVEGTGVPTLNRNMFHNKQIVDVSIDEQNQFADFVKQVDKSKSEVKKALDKTQLLFDSLMQQYFG